MKMKRLVLTLSLCAVMFSAACAAYLLGLVGEAPAKEIRTVTEAPYGAKELEFYESDRLFSIGFSETDIECPRTALRGEYVTVKLKGEAGAIYGIRTYTPSGKSYSSVFESKRADAYGEVSWTWKISKSIADGDVRVIIFGDDGYAQMKMRIA